jgi:hypothetical protein
MMGQAEKVIIKEARCYNKYNNSIDSKIKLIITKASDQNEKKIFQVDSNIAICLRVKLG